MTKRERRIFSELLRLSEEIVFQLEKKSEPIYLKPIREAIKDAKELSL